MTKLSPPHCARAAMTALALVVVLNQVQPASASTGWAPVASERLIRLPGESLEKAIENDFARSGLARQLGDVEERIALKQMTLGDMKEAVDRLMQEAAEMRRREASRIVT